MLVKTSLEYLDALYKEGGSDPRLQEELGIAYNKVASSRAVIRKPTAATSPERWTAMRAPLPCSRR